MLKNKNKILITISLALFCILQTLNAQNRIHSPYSRFGLGDMQPYYNSQYFAMGGLGYAISSPTSVNILNPASYSRFDSLSFIFEGGLYSNFNKSEAGLLSQKSNYTSLAYLTFGFPINRWWKASFGLLPYSSVGYKVTNTKVEPYFGNVDYKYEGQGGINQFFIGQSVKINSRLSFGLNVSYLFGTIDKTQTVYPLDSAFVYNIRVKTTRSYGTFNFNFGLQYFKPLKNDFIFGSGIVFTNAMNSKVSEDYLAYSFSETSSGYEYPHDTSTNISKPGVENDLHMPMSLGAGISIEKKNKWLVGVDINWQNWADYKYNGLSDSLVNSFRISVGGMIKPDQFSTNYLKRITYRAGFRYSPTYLNIFGEQINEFGITFGLGLPLRKSKSTVNLGIEYGKRGISTNGLIQDNFTKITIGFSAYDFWFYKRKFD